MKNIDKILNLIKEESNIANSNEINIKISYSILSSNLESLKISESTLIRNLNKLIKSGKITKEEIGKNTFYKLNSIDLTKLYLEKPFFEREEKAYNFNFLKNYIPNETSFLGDRYEEIKKVYADSDISKLGTYEYKENIRGIENLLIDLSYSSSKLEGNTYSYLDTEVLIKYNEKSEGKTKEETQMILNHKNVIKYLLDFKQNILLDKKTFLEIHSILGKNLLLDKYLGVIRDKEVKTGGYMYFPLDNNIKLNAEFNIFLDKLNLIKNPFEQSLFILIFIPYFQIFLDINKRTSRISANIPLIKNGLSPISLLQIKERDYLNAVIAIYELNDYRLMRDLFVDNYILNLDRYLI